MADTSAMAELRGMDVNKLAVGFSDELVDLRNFVRTSTTSAREIRWYKKTAGFLAGPTTTGITGSLISNTASKARPVAAEPSWTRQTSYVQTFFVEGPLLTEGDIKDSDPDVLGTQIRDLVKAVRRREEIRLYNVLTDNVSGTAYDGTSVPSAAAAGGGWTASGADPVGDLTSAKKSIRSYNYDPEGATAVINEAEEKNLIDWIINTKGSSIPNFSSEKIRSGVVLEMLGLNFVTRSTATAGVVCIFTKEACVWKSFTPLSSVVISEPLIGRKVRVLEEGEALLEEPNACYGITGC